MRHVPKLNAADRFGPQLLSSANTRTSCVQSAFSHGFWLHLATANVRSQREAETYFSVVSLTSFVSRLQRDDKVGLLVLHSTDCIHVKWNLSKLPKIL